MMARRAFLALAALALAGVWPVVPAAADSLTVVSWGGSYGRASRAAVLEPFAAESGIEVKVADYNGGLAEIRAQVETGNVYWDVVDMEIQDLVQACDEGLLEFFDPAALPPSANGGNVALDYLPDTITDCGAGQLFAATIFAYSREHFTGAKVPRTIADFFDLKNFPGRRGMRRIAKINLEFALMADGVPMEEVYAVLQTPAGRDRAFAKLDTIKDAIVWWEAGAQPPQMLADGEVAMTTAYNGRIFNAQVQEDQPFVVVWDGQVLYSGGMGIVAGSSNLPAARQMLVYASRPEVMARISQYISYSPARHSAMALVGKHLATGIDMAPHLPTSPQNMARALRYDWRWWSDNGDDMAERFAAWLAR